MNAMHRLQHTASCVTAGKHPENDEEAEFIPQTTGSVAEYYIEPMLPYVGDLDAMFYHNNNRPVTRGGSGGSYEPPHAITRSAL